MLTDCSKDECEIGSRVIIVLDTVSEMCGRSELYFPGQDPAASGKGPPFEIERHAVGNASAADTRRSFVPKHLTRGARSHQSLLFNIGPQVLESL